MNQVFSFVKNKKYIPNSEKKVYYVFYNYKKTKCQKSKISTNYKSYKDLPFFADRNATHVAH